MNAPDIIKKAFHEMKRVMNSTPQNPTKAQFRRYRAAVGWYYAVRGMTIWEITSKHGVPVDAGVQGGSFYG